MCLQTPESVACKLTWEALEEEIAPVCTERQFTLLVLMLPYQIKRGTHFFLLLVLF
jgi:hypothetical protein